jgi:eukaryotic-like serine/threonine-protein kinase
MLTSGTKLGPYEIVAPLGAGGMGEVYRARDTRLDRSVAIKVLPKHLSSDPEAKQRFDREARAISSLNHPNICTLHDVGHQDGTDFLVMELLEGETLADRLAKGPLPPDQVLKYGIEICEGLERAHKSGVVHRDLKPGNVMLTKTGAKLMDFGLAKSVTVANAPAAGLTATLMSPGVSHPLTAQGTVLGTFQYMSPEQVEGKDADVRSDIFALGAVLYEMATGKRAFTGKSQASIVAAILASEPQAISAVQPMAPVALDRVVKTCLEKDPDERFQTVHDLKLQLKWISEGGSQVGIPAPVAARRKFPPVIWAVAAIALVAGAALSAAYFLQAGHPKGVIRASVLAPEGSEFLSLDIEGGAPAISPDGKQLAFVARDKQGAILLWLRPIDSISARPLTGTETAGHPFWSPDSRSVGFFARNKLQKIDIASGSVQTICEAGLGRGGSWSKDGVILFTPNTTDVLYRVAAAGGNAVKATQFDASRGENSHRWPYFLPDGKHYLFFVRSSQGTDVNGVYGGALDSKEHHLLLRTGYSAAYAEPGYLLSVREQSLVEQPFDANKVALTGDPVPVAEHVAENGATSEAMFSVSQNGVLAYQPGQNAAVGWNLVMYDRSGKKVSDIGTNLFLWPSLSPDATKVAVGVTDIHFGTPDLWAYDLARGTRTRLTFEPGREGNAVWMPDGQSVIFGSDQTGLTHVYRKSINGTGATETVLETADTVEVPRSVCHDGRYLLYERRAGNTKTKYDIWALPLGGDHKPFPLVQSDFDDLAPAFSPDCNCVAYMSDDSGQFEVYITHFPDATGKYQVSTSGGVNPHWRGDGKELFFVSPQDRNLNSVSVAQQGKGLELGSARKLFPTHAVSQQLGPFDVSADGQRFLVNGENVQVTNEPVTLVVNWDAELKK